MRTAHLELGQSAAVTVLGKTRSEAGLPRLMIGCCTTCSNGTMRGDRFGTGLGTSRAAVAEKKPNILSAGFDQKRAFGNQFRLHNTLQVLMLYARAGYRGKTSRGTPSQQQAAIPWHNNDTRSDIIGD